MPVPALRIKETQETLNALLAGYEEVNKFAVARISRDIATIKSKDSVQGFIFEGILASILHDQNASIAAFDKAVYLAGNTHLGNVHYNYGLCLMQMGNLWNALDHLRLATSYSPLDIHAITLMARMGAVQEANAIFHQNKNLDHFQYADTADYFQKMELADESVINVLSIATKRVWDAGFFVCGGKDFVTDDGVLRQLLVHHQIPSETLTQWEWDLDDTLSEQNNPLLHAGFSVSFEWAKEESLDSVA